MPGSRATDAASGSRRRQTANLVVLALAVLLGCRLHRETPDEHAARTAVMRYNEALVRAFRDCRAERLHGVATDEEVSRVAAVIAGLLRDQKYMEARQTQFKVERIGVTSQRADVDAVEEWSYEHRPLPDRNRAAPAKAAKYRLTYQLKRTSSGWEVDKVLHRGAQE